MKFTKTNLKELKLKDLKDKLCLKKELNIAEYSSVNVSKVKDLTQLKENKNFGINKYTVKKGKGSQADLERKREKMLSMGDIVRSSRYGVGKVINKSKKANLLKKATISFVSGGIIDVFPESLIIIKKRELRKGK